jgi:hypothetical protein
MTSSLHPLIAAFISDPRGAEPVIQAQCSGRISAATAPRVTKVCPIIHLSKPRPGGGGNGAA